MKIDRQRYLFPALMWLVLLGCGASLRAQAAADPQDFVTAASEASVAEIEAGKLALQKSQSTDVKTFAQHMIDDHTRVNQELSTLAGKLNLKVEDEAALTDKAKSALLDLRDESFDPAYANNQVMAHEQAVKLFSDAAQNQSDAQLKAFAKAHLGTLKHHLHQAKALAKAHPSK